MPGPQTRGVDDAPSFLPVGLPRAARLNPAKENLVSNILADDEAARGAPSAPSSRMSIS